MKALLRLLESFLLFIWDATKNKLYGDQDGPVALDLAL